MENYENLKHLTSEEARENGKKGGKASVAARRKKIELRQCFEALLEGKIEVRDKDGKIRKMTGAEALSYKVYQKAMSGDIKAFEVLRDTAGQKPIEESKVSVSVPVIVTDDIEQ